MSINNKSYNCWISTPVWYGKGSNIEIWHGLDVDPEKCICDVRLKCAALDANSGYAVGDYASGISFYAGNVTVDPPVIPTLLQDRIILQIPEPDNSHTPFVIMSKADANTSSTVFLPNVECWQLEFRVWYPKEIDIALRLRSDTTFYVRKDGNDNNDGLTAATAYLSLDKLNTTLASLQGSLIALTIDIGAGTWTATGTGSEIEKGCVFLRNLGGFSSVVVRGAGSSKTIIDGQSANFGIIAHNPGTNCYISNLTVQNCICGFYAFNANMVVSNVRIGACTMFGLDAVHCGTLTVVDTCEFFGDCNAACRTANFSSIRWTGDKVIFTGTPTFTNTVHLYVYSNFSINPTTIIEGAANGRRWLVSQFSHIVTHGRGINLIPGSSAGVTETATGGLYF